jgi:hypothetical protein
MFNSYVTNYQRIYGIPYTTYILEVKNQRFLWPCSMAVFRDTHISLNGFCESCWVSWNPVCHRRCSIPTKLQRNSAAYSLGKIPWFQENGWNKTDIWYLHIFVLSSLYKSLSVDWFKRKSGGSQGKIAYTVSCSSIAIMKVMGISFEMFHIFPQNLTWIKPP